MLQGNKEFSCTQVGYDAAFGDFTSSLFDIKLRKGNAKKLEGGLNANLNNASLNLGFPIISNKSAIFVYARKSYGKINIDGILENVLFPDSRIDMSKNYYDIIAKTYTQVGKKNKFSLTYYKGHDNINGSGQVEEEDQEGENQLEEEVEMDFAWGNQIGLINC